MASGCPLRFAWNDGAIPMTNCKEKAGPKAGFFVDRSAPAQYFRTTGWTGIVSAGLSQR